jgi:hypothetical protein
MVSTEQANIARITHTSFGDQNPFDIIFRGLVGDGTVTTRSFLYHLKNVEIFELDIYNRHERVIYGELFKAKLSSSHDVLDINTLNYNHAVIDEKFSSSRFTIFRDLSIVYTSNARLDSDLFKSIFKQLYRENAEELFSQIEIHYRKEDFDIFEKIRLFASLIQVELINIRKSNPSPKPTFAKIEAFLEREKTDVYSGKFVSEKPEGLARDLDSHIMSGISIADSAYGDSIILGQNPDGGVEKIRLSDNRISKRIQKVPYENKIEFVRLISSKFYRYLSLDEDLVDDKGDN